MSTLDLIRARRSVRTFDGRSLAAEDAQRILDCARKAENPYGLSMDWRVLSAADDGLSAPVIVGADTYIAGKINRAPHAEEAFGYTLEQVVLYAQSLGVGTTWIAGTLDRPAFERAMQLGADEAMPCVSPLGYPASKLSLREGLMRKGVKADSRLDFGALFFDGDWNTPLTPARAGEWADCLEAVRLAPSAVNKQPWRVVLDGRGAHFYEQRSRGYVSDAGWDVQKIDLGIALCHFDLMQREKGLHAAFALRNPGLPLPPDTVYIASYLTE